ncbi:MAG: DUF2799 domain-containing protein [Pseudomonadota bacterium]|nr:DUF2799 domain-containing protein [Pseudomonadota bacterium]
MTKITLALIVLTALLGGCESMSPSECATANWRERGLNDGRQGRPDSAADYHESCAKAGVQMDVPSYRAGRTDGLQSYCRLGNAIQEGLAGRSYHEVCPLPADQDFKVFHAAAYREQEARKTLARLQDEQKQWERELLNDKTAPQRKATLRDQLARSDRHIAEARDELRSAQHRLDRLRKELRQQGLN